MVFLGRKKVIWLLFSTVLLLGSVIALLTWKLPLGIDFRGGAQMEVSFRTDVSENDLRQKLATYPEVRGQSLAKTEKNSFLIKMLTISNEEHQQLLEKLRRDFGELEERQFQLVGPSVSKDLTRKAIWAVVLATLAIVLYLAYAFRKVSHPLSPWRFGLVAVAALIHDLIIAVGCFALIAKLFNLEVDAAFIVALLTVMGFSVHDTIVTFDRVRENILAVKNAHDGDFEYVVDSALVQTLNRSIGTSLTFVFTAAALVALGGESIRAFVVVLLIGVIIGTYSSTFVAGPLIVIWQNVVERRLRKKQAMEALIKTPTVGG